MPIPILVLFVLSFISLTSCMQETKTTSTLEEKSSVEKSLSKEEHALLHYWDEFDFSDPNALSDPTKGEQQLVYFIALLPKASKKNAWQAIRTMLSKAKSNPKSFQYFIAEYEKYLYNPNSPMRNDLYFEPVLAFVVDSTALNKDAHNLYSAQLELIRKNQEGTKSVDFNYQLPNGSEGSLYTLKSPYTLLFFYEPGCSFCEAAIEELESAPEIQLLLDEKLLQVLAVYPFSDKEIWDDYQTKIPALWKNAFDVESEILSNTSYDLKATPTLYLLDQEKNVILKDTDLFELRKYLENVQS